MSENREWLQETHPLSGNEDRASATRPKVYSRLDDEAFRKGMRQLSAAVTVVTTGIDAQRRAGRTATAVCSVSAEPPQLLVCVNRRDEGHARIREWRNFCVNVLCHAQIDIAKRFAGMDRGAHPERFDQGEWGGWRRPRQGWPAAWRTSTVAFSRYSRAGRIASSSGRSLPFVFMAARNSWLFWMGTFWRFRPPGRLFRRHSNSTGIGVGNLTLSLPRLREAPVGR